MANADTTWCCAYTPVRVTGTPSATRRRAALAPSRVMGSLTTMRLSRSIRSMPTCVKQRGSLIDLCKKRLGCCPGPSGPVQVNQAHACAAGWGKVGDAEAGKGSLATMGLFRSIRSMPVDGWG